MASSQDFLQETVFELLAHNQSLDKMLFEVSSLRQTCKDDLLFARLTAFGCLPMLKSHDQPVQQNCGTEMCVDRVMSLYTDIGHIAEDKTTEFQSLVLMLKQIKQTGKLNISRLKNKLQEFPRVPLHFLWTLHKEGIFNLEQYFNIQNNNVVAGELFVSKMTKAGEERQHDVISGVLTELFSLGFSEEKVAKASICDMIVSIVDKFCISLVEDAIKKDNSDRLVISLSSVQLDIDTMKRVCTHILTVILGHKPVLKVSQAIREQEKWAYGKISPALTDLYKQFLLPFEVSEILQLLKQILEQQEVNWQLLLSLVSVTMVCMPETAKLFLEFTDNLLQEGLDCCEMETTIMGILLARQACFQGPHVFLSYSDWFQRTFSDGSRSLASNRKSFTFLMKFLTDLVPYESALHIKVHISHPPFVPAKCRQLLTDYIELAKTRLEDLKESMDIPDDEENSTSVNQKGKQIISDVENAVRLFETSGKVPTSILEASIFRKPYYIGQFLPALLHPRPLPDMPDSKMRLIAALKRADKIPVSMYTAYEKACKREASQLLEGVFIDSDTDDEMELSPFELLENTLQLLKNRIKNRESLDTLKQTEAEILSQLCGRLETVLSISPHVSLHTPSPVSIDTENPRLESLHLKVIDVLLTTLSESLQLCYMQQSPDFSWLTMLLQSISQYPDIIEALYNRIFILTIKQGIHLANHHVDCIAAILVELQLLWQQLPCVLICHKGQVSVETKFTEYIIDHLPVRTSSWMNLSLRLTTSCLKFMYSRYEELDIGDLLPALIKKFIYLSTRQNAQLRNFDKWGDITKGDNIVCAVYMSENFQHFANNYPLTVSEWVNFEISVCPDNDSLTHFQRYEYFTWIIYRYFLCQSQENIISIASAVVQGIVKYDMRHNHNNMNCCDCCEQITSPSNSRTVLINLLQELTSRFPTQTREACETLPWLPQQLMNLLSDEIDEMQQLCIIHQFFRLGVCLPGYLMYCDTLYMINLEISLNPVTQFIKEILVPHLCEGLFLPTSITVFLCQGLFQVSKVDHFVEMLNKMCELCPVFMLSLMRHCNLVEPFLPKDLSCDHPLHHVIESARGNTSSSFVQVVKPWQQAGVLFSIAVSTTNREECSVLNDYLTTTSDEVLRFKALKCLVQMLFLQLTYLENCELPKFNSERGKIGNLLTHVLTWREGKYLNKMCFPDNLHKDLSSCMNTKLEKMVPLTLLRYFATMKNLVSIENILNEKFLTGILTAYSKCLLMFEENRSCCNGESKLMTLDEMQCVDQYVVRLMRSASQDDVRNIDKDLLHSCGPVIVDCVINNLKM